jgi:bacillithiol biosynthesis deacetylase BshB1
MKLDILVLAAHPDDAELGCGGTIAKFIAQGFKVGIVDLTQGELGTRGTPEIRKSEAEESSGILGITARENLYLADGFFRNIKEDKLAIVKAVRKFQPEIVLANAVFDRHPDHGRASELIYDACFVAGLSKVETKLDGESQPAWRPRNVYHFIQSQSLQPDFIIDISEYWEMKLKAIKAFKSQFYDPYNSEPETYISNPGFLKMVEARAIEHGHAIGVKYGEGFTVRRPIGIKNLFDLI